MSLLILVVVNCKYSVVCEHCSLSTSMWWGCIWLANYVTRRIQAKAKSYTRSLEKFNTTSCRFSRLSSATIWNKSVLQKQFVPESLKNLMKKELELVLNVCVLSFRWGQLAFIRWSIMFFLLRPTFDCLRCLRLIVKFLFSSLSFHFLLFFLFIY